MPLRNSVIFYQGSKLKLASQWTEIFSEPMPCSQQKFIKPIRSLYVTRTKYLLGCSCFESFYCSRELIQILKSIKKTNTQQTRPATNVFVPSCFDRALRFLSREIAKACTTIECWFKSEFQWISPHYGVGNIKFSAKS